jgi:nucleotide-binding universal stress UspA family protein
MTDGIAPVAFQNILYATDLSYLSEASLPYARKIAQMYRAKVYAVHVRCRGVTWDRPEENAIASLNERLGDIPHQVMVRDGEVEPILLGVIDEMQIDLVVMSTHGRRGLGRVLLGSTAEAIFRAVRCPVLTVGPRLNAESQTEPAIREVLFATDLTPTSEAAVPYAVSMARESRARLTILNVQSSAKAGQNIPAEDYAAATLDRLRELVPADAPLGSEPRFLAERGDPAEKILDVAGQYRADLIVMGVRPNGLGTATHIARPTVHRVVAGALCPVLTIRG